MGTRLGVDSLAFSIEAEGKDWPEIDLKGKVELNPPRGKPRGMRSLSRFNYTGLQVCLRVFY